MLFLKCVYALMALFMASVDAFNMDLITLPKTLFHWANQRILQTEISTSLTLLLILQIMTLAST